MAITSFKAGEAISAGELVYVSSASYVYKASSIVLDQASVVGIAVDSGIAGSLIRVNCDAVYPSASGVTPGEYRYLSILVSGQHVPYSTWASELASTAYDGAYLTNIGRAVSTTSVEIEIAKPLFISNPTSVLLMESSTGVILDAILQEDGSTIDLETA
jgi:hypothetical protein